MEYSLITIMFGNETISFSKATITVKGEELMIIVEVNPNNLNSLLCAGVSFVKLDSGYRFYVLASCLYGVER
jgi:hypothetical protein